MDTDANGVVRYDPSGTFIELGGILSAHAGVRLRGKFLAGVAALTGTGFIDPALTIDARAEFQGPVSSLPTVASTSLTGVLSGTYGFDLTAQLLFGTINIPLFSTADNGTADDVFSYNLFRF